MGGYIYITPRGLYMGPGDREVGKMKIDVCGLLLIKLSLLFLRKRKLLIGLKAHVKRCY